MKKQEARLSDLIHTQIREIIHSPSDADEQLRKEIRHTAKKGFELVAQHAAYLALKKLLSVTGVNVSNEILSEIILGLTNDSTDHNTYKIIWSKNDLEFVGLCIEFPSLSHLAATEEEALRGIKTLVASVKSETA